MNLRQFVGRFPQASIVAVSAKNSTGITEVKEALHAALKMNSTPAEMPEPANNKPKAAVSYPINDN